MLDTTATRGRSPLFRWRTDQRLTQAQAADKLGMLPTQYAGYENAVALPRRETLQTIEHKTARGMAAAIVLYHFGIDEQEAACYFRQQTQSQVATTEPS